MPERRRAGRIVASGVVVVALVAGALVVVGWFRSRLPGDPWELDQACAGKAYAKAAPYQPGKAPNPVAIFMTSDAGFLEYTTLYPPKDSAWAPSEPEETADVRLVVCATLAGEVATGDNCGFGVVVASKTIPMVRATYQVRVYELRTHRELRSVTVQGEDTDCPPAISASYTPSRLLSEPTFAQWQQVLADLVSG